MLVNINVTGANTVPFQVGLSQAEDTSRVVVVVYLAGDSYSRSQLDDFLNEQAGKPGFEWLNRSGKLWSIDAGKLGQSYPDLQPIPWFKGRLVTTYETRFGTLHGSMGNIGAKGGGIAMIAHHPFTTLTFALDEEVASDSNRIFYSWMSDQENFSNRTFIENCLKKAVKEIARDDSIGITPSLDRDTQGETGSPDIADTIFKKITRARAFVADVTVMTSPLVGWRKWMAHTFRIASVRPSPNPNVLVELGFAASTLGWEKCLLIVNTAFGPVEQLPFDLRGRRIIPYNVAKKGDLEAAKTSLIPYLKNRLAEAMELKKTS